MSVDTKLARQVASDLGYGYRAVLGKWIESLSDEVDKLREMTRCAEHRNDKSNANGCPGCVRDMRDDVQTKWKPLLEASREYLHGSGDESLAQIQVAIAACEALK